MKKLIKGLLVLVLTFSCALGFTSCKKDEKGETSRVTVDINPSIELIVDEDQKVVSVTALNDDGAIIISGEAIVGKTVEDAVKLIVNVSTETGYLVKGEVEASPNNVKISVSGDSEYAKKLNDKLVESTKKFLEDSGIKAGVEKVKAMAIEDLRKLVVKYSAYTEEEVAEMSEEDLIKALAVGRIETAQLISEEMKKLYFEAKEYEISFAQREETAKIIKGLGSAYTILYNSYADAVNAYREVIDQVEQVKYDALISPDSAYQQALTAMRDAKVKYLEKKSFVASLEIGDTRLQVEIKNLENLKAKYEEFEKAYVEAGNKAIEGFDKVISYLRQAEEVFNTIDKNLLTKDVEKTLTDKANELEKAMNEVKDNYFEAFEKAHADDIAKIDQALADKKAELKASINKK